MRIRLVDAVVGDRFIGHGGVAWTVTKNEGGLVTVIASGHAAYTNRPPPDFHVDITNRDDSLTTEQAIANLVEAGLEPRLTT